MDMTSTVKRVVELPTLSRKIDEMGTNGIHDINFSNGASRQSVPVIKNKNCSNNSSLQRMMTDTLVEEGSNCHSNSELNGSSIFSKRKVRFIKKSGHCNVSHSNLSDKPKRFIADIFTTGVDLQWRWNLFVFSSAFVISWLLFGLIFWILSYIHGDFDDSNYFANSTFLPCVKNLDSTHSFTSSFLFSLETQTTIGYGLRVVTEECPVTIIMVVIQSVFGCILDAFMIGLIMAKISRPKKRAETLLFSKNAVINMRDGQLCLMFRVGNLRKSHLVEATIRMQYVYSRETMEGEFIPLEQVDLNLDLKNDSDRLFLVTPQTICHPIDESSPLWNLHQHDLNNANFEIIVILEGMVEATGMTTQARASYLPSEVLWGHRFTNMISLTQNNAYKVNFKKFHKTYHTNDAPCQSAKELDEAATSDIRSMLESGVTYRGKKQKDSSSNTSSNRSSVQSSQHNQSSASDGRDSGYTAVEDLPRANSNHSLNLSNKPMTSTTSLSDESDASIRMMNSRESANTRGNFPQAAVPNNSNLDANFDKTIETNSNQSSRGEVDPVLINIDEVDANDPWKATKCVKRAKSFRSSSDERSSNISSKENMYKSSDDIKLLLVNTPDDDPTDNSLVKLEETEFTDKQFDKAFSLIPMENKNTVCV